MSERGENRAEKGSPETDRPREEPGGGRRLVRIIFWLLFIYALALALLVLEDIMNHTYI
jgi:hypothetical protein